MENETTEAMTDAQFDELREMYSDYQRRVAGVGGGCRDAGLAIANVNGYEMAFDALPSLLAELDRLHRRNNELRVENAAMQDRFVVLDGDYCITPHAAEGLIAQLRRENAALREGNERMENRIETGENSGWTR